MSETLTIKEYIQEIKNLEKEDNKRKKLLKKIREILFQDNQNICFCELCQGKIKNIEDFIKNCNHCKEYANYCFRKTYKEKGQKHQHYRLNQKIGKSCELCGEKELIFLEFDHIKPENKIGPIAGLPGCKKIKEEIKKTRILCVWCHRLHSKKQRELNKKIYKTFPAGDHITDWKICNGPLCNGIKRNKLTDFHKRKNGVLQSKCKECTNYNMQLNRIKKRNYVNDIKLQISCCNLCNIKVTSETTCCFDFDHLDRSKKVNTISRMTQINSIQKIEKEIEKCQLLCCYCHVRKTSKQLNYTSVKDFFINSKHDLEQEKEEVKNCCIDCNIAIYDNKAKRCVKCSGFNRRKVKDRPSLEQLLEDKKTMTMVAIGKKYNVSDSAVRKWIKNYQNKVGT